MGNCCAGRGLGKSLNLDDLAKINYIEHNSHRGSFPASQLNRKTLLTPHQSHKSRKRAKITSVRTPPPDLPLSARSKMPTPCSASPLPTNARSLYATTPLDARSRPPACSHHLIPISGLY